MSRQNGDSQGSVPQVGWGTDGRGVPMVVVAAPPPEPAATRGVTGLYVLLVLAVATLALAYLVYGNWVSGNSYAQQLSVAESITRDADGMDGYVNLLINQNEEMCRNPQGKPAAPPLPLLQEDIERRRLDYDRLCADNIGTRRTGTQCVIASPAPTTARTREQLCRDYSSRR